METHPIGSARLRRHTGLGLTSQYCGASGRDLRQVWERQRLLSGISACLSRLVNASLAHTAILKATQKNNAGTHGTNALPDKGAVLSCVSKRLRNGVLLSLEGMWQGGALWQRTQRSAGGYKDVRRTDDDPHLASPIAAMHQRYANLAGDPHIITVVREDYKPPTGVCREHCQVDSVGYSPTERVVKLVWHHLATERMEKDAPQGVRNPQHTYALPPQNSQMTGTLQ
ncbi:hypothetical protein GLOTRDRAFT_92061 [Gloeophyllum trabeum ATCC 11539]|uniref:Uncharacterized protein n=1 Tax=Gloeophyllum trabeum (strain ATCC 11539 / FP-39264 / Madison 617) TaxID=670483 RepID=S7RUG1_GLOTA|nr:uncharacterized protein GLOTRDRAFT_92061 [Gloeophyllum trabeum ATCC 11539]EPQ56839.1 hypothetical protein GLOTRDRAFT_92061 [Gloeophyllum trabeum ATCC 11539]